MTRKLKLRSTATTCRLASNTVVGRESFRDYTHSPLLLLLSNQETKCYTNINASYREQCSGKF